MAPAGRVVFQEQKLFGNAPLFLMPQATYFLFRTIADNNPVFHSDWIFRKEQCGDPVRVHSFSLQ